MVHNVFRNMIIILIYIINMSSDVSVDGIPVGEQRHGKGIRREKIPTGEGRQLVRFYRMTQREMESRLSSVISLNTEVRAARHQQNNIWNALAICKDYQINVLIAI